MSPLDRELPLRTTAKRKHNRQHFNTQREQNTPAPATNRPTPPTVVSFFQQLQNRTKAKHSRPKDPIKIKIKIKALHPKPGVGQASDPHLNGLLAADPVTSDTVSDGTHGISEREKGTSPPLPLTLPPPPPPPPAKPLPRSLGESENFVASEEKVEDESDVSDADCRGGG